jgi:hypothetical protein
MTLDEVLKEHSAWLDKAAKQPIFGRVTEKETNFPQDLRDRRATEITAAIEALTRRRDETVARYESAIDGYKKELEALKAAPTPMPSTAKPMAASAQAVERQAKAWTTKPAAPTKETAPPRRRRDTKK